jgi:hypothetical protein
MAPLIRTASSTIAGIAITGDGKPIGLHLGLERICSEPIFIELRRNVGTTVTVPAVGGDDGFIDPCRDSIFSTATA